MWKVKRMNTARIVVMADAVGAGGIAACFASGSDTSIFISSWPAAQPRTGHFPVSQADLELGATAKKHDLRGPAKRPAVCGDRSDDQACRPGNRTMVGGGGVGKEPTPTRLKGRSI